ncbi:MAG: glycosyltransferase [Phycisphaerae bacterium]|nr:glycosyltransferase [Saprospiraceae bacterium]
MTGAPWKHQAVNRQKSTINSQQSTVNSQRSTVNSQQSTVNSQQSTVNSQRFLFSIGIHPKKNYHVLMPILKEFTEYKWIIAGPDSRGYRAKIEQEAAKFGVADRIEFCGPVGDETKLGYYQNCTALLFPSLSEGFGLPVVEAMSLGKPVFLSDRTSLPEIGGSEAYYFKDFEPQTLTKTFATGLKDFENDPEKPTRMKDWASQFTWGKAATQYLEFYQELLTINH